MFLTMLMVRDPDHVVRLPLRVLAKKANLSEDKEEAYRLAVEAVRVLQLPDSRSHDNQEFEGRRIERVEGDHWLVLNGEKYLEQMKTLWARMRKTQKQRARRDAARAQVAGGSTASERAFERAVGDGDEVEADRIAAAGLRETVGPGVSPGAAVPAISADTLAWAAKNKIAVPGQVAAPGPDPDPMSGPFPEV